MSTIKTVPTNSGFLLSFKGELPSSNVIGLKLSLNEDGTAKSYADNRGVSKALLSNSELSAFAYITTEILAKLQFDDNGFTTCEIVRMPDVKDIKPTKSIAMGA